MSLTVYFDPDYGEILVMKDGEDDPHMIINYVFFCPTTEEKRTITISSYDEDGNLIEDESVDRCVYRVPYNVLCHVKINNRAYSKWAKALLNDLMEELNCSKKKEVIHERYRR